VDVVEIATDVARAMEPAAKRKDLELKLIVPGELRIESDAPKVRQILSNLVSNAIKFTERGGVEIGAERLDGGALLRVRDTGIGMEPENLARIFEPFWQAETATTRKQGGTGLGLSVSRKLARMLGGEIEVTSELGRGTEFTVRLPAAPPRAPEPDGAGAGPQ
jgi:signal transduction histidine kinase